MPKRKRILNSKDVDDRMGTEVAILMTVSHHNLILLLNIVHFKVNSRILFLYMNYLFYHWH